MKTEITFEDVVAFIIQNADNTEMMDKLNRMTFAFTSKFKKVEKYEKDELGFTL